MYELIVKQTLTLSVYLGIDYVLNIFIADTTLLKNFLIWIAISNSPYICNTFAGPKLGETFLKHSSWRWGYGSFAIITPFTSIPFWAIFWIMSRRAKKLGVIKREKSDRTLGQSIMYWCVEFDGEIEYRHCLLLNKN
jgi:hypothetical protein